MKIRFRKQIEEIQNGLTALADLVSENVKQTLNAVLSADGAAARQVIRNEYEINRKEVLLEEACIRVMTLHQPVADELRFLIATLKVNHDLERIGDLAAGIAKRTHLLTAEGVSPFREKLQFLTKDIENILAQSMSAFFSRDHHQAARIWIGDDTVDARTSILYDDIRKVIVKQGEQSRALFALLEISQRIERLADHAANIAKNVIFLAMGEIVRHRMREFREQANDTKPKVLMVCVHNSARSQMAAAWVNHLYGDRIQAESAGLSPGTLNPLTVRVMKEIGIDISGARPRDVFEVLRTGHPFSQVVMVCDETSAEKCPPFPGVQDVLHWDLPDPAEPMGDESQQLEKFRQIRDELRRRVDSWMKNLLTDRSR